ncbi:MAG: flippase-like domain-containing protein [Ignavibacteriales bacterium]|nr:MAG: hypothetical protein F9K26_01315 [Ignavibacteriaceae bacterium]MBW7872049.1 flippase-like domain-containing protein [Ignavibacteria bacterium]MCZ2143684.1 flippase-like domain-containing protein [Ignavibacteriales bacterium]OQY79718.1 MAG: hypothetical protein B6D45_00385 [Ignavibacteriales bacterium UTCHB3]MBV6446053.1 hypothetical protein [Ignavibacteriaceae bacterium]
MKNLIKYLKNNRTQIWFYLRYITGITIFLGIVHFAFSLSDQLPSEKIEINPFFLLLGIFLIVFSTLIVHMNWVILMSVLGVKICKKNSLFIRIKAELGKYVPGRLVQYGILIAEYNRYSISKTLTAFASLIEVVIMLMSLVFVYALSELFSQISINGDYRLLIAIMAAIQLIVLHPKILSVFINLLNKQLKRPPVKLTLKYRTILLLIIISSVAWLIFGCAYYFLIKSFSEISFSEYWYLTGGLALSSLIGTITFFVPAGLGVRESGLIYLLKDNIGGLTVSIASIMFRFLTVFADILLYFASVLWSKFSKKKRN